MTRKFPKVYAAPASDLRAIDGTIADTQPAAGALIDGSHDHTLHENQAATTQTFSEPQETDSNYTFTPLPHTLGGDVEDDDDNWPIEFTDNAMKTSDKQVKESVPEVPPVFKFLLIVACPYFLAMLLSLIAIGKLVKNSSRLRVQQILTSTKNSLCCLHLSKSALGAVCDYVATAAGNISLHIRPAANHLSNVHDHTVREDQATRLHTLDDPREAEPDYTSSPRCRPVEDDDLPAKPASDIDVAIWEDTVPAMERRLRLEYVRTTQGSPVGKTRKLWYEPSTKQVFCILATIAAFLLVLLSAVLPDSHLVEFFLNSFRLLLALFGVHVFIANPLKAAIQECESKQSHMITVMEIILGGIYAIEICFLVALCFTTVMMILLPLSPGVPHEAFGIQSTSTVTTVTKYHQMSPLPIRGTLVNGERSEFSEVEVWVRDGSRSDRRDARIRHRDRGCLY